MDRVVTFEIFVCRKCFAPYLGYSMSDSFLKFCLKKGNFFSIVFTQYTCTCSSRLEISIYEYCIDDSITIIYYTQSLSILVRAMHI